MTRNISQVVTQITKDSHGHFLRGNETKSNENKAYDMPSTEVYTRTHVQGPLSTLLKVMLSKLLCLL